jgi:hypothetical protein
VRHRVIHALVLVLACCAMPAVAAEDTLAPGAAIFRQGSLPDGQLLRGERAIGGALEGAAAACVNCHRRSGLGAAEGNIIIPPITGKYLYRPDGGRMEDVDLQYAQGRISLNHQAYSDATLARAISEGIGRDSRSLNPLMPRFRLAAAEMAVLIDYLKNLGRGPVPGVTEDTLHFATIITPDADPVARRGMLDVLERFFIDKNEFIRGGLRRMRGYQEINFRVSRKWQLHVWELRGAPATWAQQLREHQAAEPVFAVISGLGGKTWTPVHHFCEQAALPCLFPNVDLPVVAENDFYPVYFSRGVELEADLIAGEILEKKPIRRVVQVFRRDDIGPAAALVLGRSLSKAGLKTQLRALPAGQEGGELASALRDAGKDDALVLWLRPADLARLPAKLGEARQIFVSGLMGGMEEAPLPPAWRPVVRMSYPVDLPELRKFRTDFPHAWFRIRHIPVVADRIQSDTYLACGIMAETLVDMLDSFVPDYLLERIESMLSRRTLSAYYPRLGLAPGQRFASKGGYLVAWPRGSGGQPVAEGGWRTP